MNGSAKSAGRHAAAPAPKPAGKPKRKETKMKKTAATVGRIAVSFFLIVVITGLIVIGAMTFYVIKVEDPGALDLDNVKLSYTTVFYAKDSKTGNFSPVDKVYTKNRVWVDLDKIPMNMRNAVVAVEDQRFNSHSGVDWKRTFTAFANVYLHFWKTEQGGSTITQQLVKNITGENEVRFTRKIREILMAINTEHNYSKDIILQAYLNTVLFGNNSYGVQTAANTYFGKDISQLDLAQCATLAGLVQSPNNYEPFKHPDEALRRRKTVLNDMLAQGYITQKQHDDAINENLVYNKQQYAAQKTTIHNWFIDEVIRDVQSDLISKKGYTKKQAQSLIYSQGLQIYTTEDPRIQSIMESVYAYDSNFTSITALKDAQSAMLMATPTGQIVGIVGGRGKKTANMLLCRATQATRQPGSTIKPIAVYGPAMDLNLINWSSSFLDYGVATVNGRLWPKNDDGSYTRSYMSVEQGLAESRNTIAVRAMQLLTPKRSYDFLTNKLGFTSLVGSDVNLGLALGSITNGVTLREMVGGYEIFDNNGKFTLPYTYTVVKDSQGNVLLQNAPAAVQALKPDTAYVMNQLLQQVHLRSDGTANYLNIGSMPAACKTGTTDSNHDRWFMGLTPYYVGGVWFGCDQQKDVGYGRNPALYLWQDVMNLVDQGLAVKSFPSPSQSSVVQSGSAWYRSANTPSSLNNRTSSAAAASKAPVSSRQAVSNVNVIGSAGASSASAASGAVSNETASNSSP